MNKSNGMTQWVRENHVQSPTWLMEDGNADLSFLVNVGVPHLSQDPKI